MNIKLNVGSFIITVQNVIVSTVQDLSLFPALLIYFVPKQHLDFRNFIPINLILILLLTWATALNCVDYFYNLHLVPDLCSRSGLPQRLFGGGYPLPHTSRLLHAHPPFDGGECGGGGRHLGTPSAGLALGPEVALHSQPWAQSRCWTTRLRRF